VSEQKQDIYAFHNFQLDIGKGILFRENQPVTLQWKTFELLCTLVRSNGNLVTRDELMNQLWADTFVEDNNLSQHIRALRKALDENGNGGAKFIETVAGRGYRFTAEVAKIPAETQPIAGTNGLSQNGAGKSFPVAAHNDRVKTAPLSIFRQTKFGIAAIFVILLLTAAFFLWLRQEPEEDESAARFLNFSSVKYQKIIENQYGQAAISPDGRFIVYTDIVGNKQTLWLRQLATNTNLQILPPNSADYRQLIFSHDSEFIFFNHKNTLYRVSVLGGEATPVIKVAEKFSLSPDDSQIAFVRTLPDYQCGLFVSNADGGAEKLISQRRDPYCYKSVAWSPNGKLIAFAAGQSDTGDVNTQLLGYQIADGKEISLSEERWFHIHSLVWLPDQSGIILSGRKKMGDENPLWQVGYPGGETRQLTDGLIRYVHLSLTADGNRLLVSQAVLNTNLTIAPADAPANFLKLPSAFYGLTWLPDGKIVYSSHINKNSLWTIKPDGTEHKQLTFDDLSYINPVASPDGRYIFYTLHGTGIQHIWRMNADGSNKIQLTDGTGEQKPNVSADGKWLFYQASGKMPITIWKIPTDGGEPVQVTKDYSLYPAVSPDDKLLAYIAREDAVKDVLHIEIRSLETGQIVKKFFFPEGDFLAASKLVWSKDGKALIYTKERLNRIANIWIQPLDASEPKQITAYNSERIFDFGWSPDDKQLAVIRGGWKNEAVLISNFR
jgi:Tol biopolymer transport system component/DNA-binding winged helix-turn-helix (wHTH) protein